MEIRYVESESMTVQGKQDEVFRKYGSSWKISQQGGGHGNWLLTRKSDVLVDGKSCRGIILDHYNKVKLTRKLFERFCDDLKSGKIKLKPKA